MVKGEWDTSIALAESRLDDDYYKCTFCNKAFRYKSHLLPHLRTHTAERPFQCNVCQMAFNHKCTLKRHLIIHTGERPFQCHICQMGFNRKSSLKAHLRIHTGNSGASLDGCKQLNATTATGGSDDSTRGQPFLMLHQVKAEPLEEDEQTSPPSTESDVKGGRHECTFCGKVFSCPSELERHVRIHTEDQAFSDSCDPLNETRATEVTEDATKIHLRLVHDGGEEPVTVKEEPHDSAASSESEQSSGCFKCTFCGKEFARQYRLVRHVRIHTGEKPFRCHICQKGFTQQTTLDGHLRIHVDERPFKCHVCQTGFKLKSTLDQHLSVHTHDRPFKCHVCHKCFSRQDTLSKHSHCHTGDKQYKCHLCNMAFSLRYSLVRHMKRSHGGPPTDST